MDSSRYRTFIDDLVAGLAADERVLGLVGLGSTSLEREPDGYSDHDFWLVVRPGTQEAFRASPWWLPEADRVVAWAFETEHGRTAIYDDAHVVEAAVFAPEEIGVTRPTLARVYLDREQIATRVAAAQQTVQTEQPRLPDDIVRVLFHCIVGTARHRRGEYLSGRRFVTAHAAEGLLRIVGAEVAAKAGAQLDPLDPWRRVEQSHPEVAARLRTALRLETTEAATVIVDLLDEATAHRADHPAAAIDTTREWLAPESA